jgi:putative transposase
MTPSQLEEIRRLEKENDLLKKLLAEIELDRRVKDKLIIKSMLRR